MALIELDNVSKSFGEGTARTDVLKNIDLDVKEGEFLVLLGFSGTGKTTLINMLAGIDTPSAGSATFKAANYGSRPRARRDLSVLLADALADSERERQTGCRYSLSGSKAEKDEVVNKYVSMVGWVTPQLRPAELSGGCANG